MTQQAVLNYKRARSIINYAYQTQADAIVGNMTIAALDDEVPCVPELMKIPGSRRGLNITASS